MRECPTCNFLVSDGAADCAFCGPVDAEIVEVTTVASFLRPESGSADPDLVPATAPLVVASERVGHEPAPTGAIGLDDDSQPSSEVGEAFPTPYPAPWPTDPTERADDASDTTAAVRAMNLTIVMCLLIGAVLLGLGITLLLVVV